MIHEQETSDALRFYRSTIVQAPHAMFCRHGGIGTPPFSSLNLSYTVGDHPDSVRENREKVKKNLRIQVLVSALQVHGDRVALVEDIRADCEYAESDALITRQRGAGLLVQQADCQAVLLHDPKRNAVAAIHNGWRGSAQNIIAATISRLKRDFGVNPQDLRAVISPSLGPCCGEFINWRSELPEELHTWRVKKNHFDFLAVSRAQLTESGVQSRYIDTVGICTVCSKDFFSYRRASRQQGRPGITGRNGSVICLP